MKSAAAQGLLKIATLGIVLVQLALILWVTDGRSAPYRANSLSLGIIETVLISTIAALWIISDWIEDPMAAEYSKIVSRAPASWPLNVWRQRLRTALKIVALVWLSVAVVSWLLGDFTNPVMNWGVAIVLLVNVAAALVGRLHRSSLRAEFRRMPWNKDKVGQFSWWI